MKAVIVAAGLSSRLRPLTDDVPKGLLDVGDTSILERAVTNLEATGHDDIVLVVRFEREQIQERLGNRARYVFNPFYETTNNMASLWFAILATGSGPFTYSHGDLVYTETMLNEFVNGATESEVALSVDFGPTDEEAMKVEVVDGRFVASNKQIPLDVAVGEWTGLARFSKSGSDTTRSHIEELLSQERFQDYDTAAFSLMASRGTDFDLLPTQGESWCEIDTAEDLGVARGLFPLPPPR